MTILIVDDNATNRVLLGALARAVSGHAAFDFEMPHQALDWCQTHTPDLLLLDYMMPDMNGCDFIRLFRALPHCADVPIIMITTANDQQIRKEALGAGATDFLHKPIDASEFRLRAKNLLALRQAQNLLHDRAKLLQHEVQRATASIILREQELVSRLAKAAEFRDPETGAHISRMAHYSLLIARGLDTEEEFQAQLLIAAPMHDIGKLGTPDSILQKPGRLDAEELRIMRLHAEIGAQILAGSHVPLIQLAAEIAGTHHEKFDGSGYPAGLRGTAIPLSGRIVAVADVFDALTSTRPYKAPWSLDSAKQYITEEAGRHFCPDCVRAFLNGWPQVLQIRNRFPD